MYYMHNVITCFSANFILLVNRLTIAVIVAQYDLLASFTALIIVFIFISLFIYVFHLFMYFTDICHGIKLIRYIKKHLRAMIDLWK